MAARYRAVVMEASKRPGYDSWRCVSSSVAPIAPPGPSGGGPPEPRPGACRPRAGCAAVRVAEYHPATTRTSREDTQWGG
ncbi:hypothetical protein GCM10023329_41350 [Streptomyces sanyensis]|uniref:Uncharacterized protein n=1 Tax=Streptomyces sanyensis TaxID=568869 RepID=A0ABP9AY79_9ACTN